MSGGATYTDQGMLAGPNGVQLRSPSEIGTCSWMHRREREKSKAF